MGDQAGISQYEFLGLQRVLPAAAPPSSSVNLLAPTSADEWVFLSDDVPVGEQGQIGRLRLRLRFFPLDPSTTMTCAKTIDYMINEVCDLHLSLPPIAPSLGGLNQLGGG